MVWKRFARSVWQLAIGQNVLKTLCTQCLAALAKFKMVCKTACRCSGASFFLAKRRAAAAALAFSNQNTVPLQRPAAAAALAFSWQTAVPLQRRLLFRS